MGPISEVCHAYHKKNRQSVSIIHNLSLHSFLLVIRGGGGGSAASFRAASAAPNTLTDVP